MENQNQVSFWQFIAFLTLILFVFSNYFRDNQKINIIFLFLISINLFSLYKISKDVFLLKKKQEGSEDYTLRIIIRTIPLVIVSYFLYYFSLLILMPDRITPLIISLSLFTILFGFNSVKKGLIAPIIKIKSHIKEIISLIFLLIIAFLMNFLYKGMSGGILRDIFVLGEWYIHIFMFIFFFIIWDFFLYLYAREFRKNQKFKLFDGLTIKRWIKVFVIVLILALFLNFPLFIMFLSGVEDPYEINQISECQVLKKYEINNQYKLLNIYIFGIPDKDYEDIKLFFEGILKKDGEYVKKDLLFNDPKSNIQYYEGQLINGFNSKIFRFYDKNIYYLDRLSLEVTENIC